MKNHNDDFRHYCGSSHHYPSVMKTFYTDGVNAMATKFDCYWLIDDISTMGRFVDRNHPEIKVQVWKLAVANGQGLLTCTYEDVECYRTQYPSVNIPDGEITFWRVGVWRKEWRLIILPSEESML